MTGSALPPQSTTPTRTRRSVTFRRFGDDAEDEDEDDEDEGEDEDENDASAVI